MVSLCLSLELGSIAVLQNARLSATFSPGSLSPTAWYDPSDMSTLFQDSAGTTPVTASGQPVGRMSDKSGNGYHLIQATSAQRPIFTESGAERWLAVDGIDDGMGCPGFTPPGSFDRISGWYSALNNYGFLLGSSSGAHALSVNHSIGVRLCGPTYGSVTAPMAANTRAVIVERYAGAASRLKVDNNAYVNDGTIGTGASAGSAGMGGNPGASEQPPAGRFYGAVIREAPFSDAEIAQIVTYLAAKQGRVL